jgi:hypothetical protein
MKSAQHGQCEDRGVIAALRGAETQGPMGNRRIQYIAMDRRRALVAAAAACGAALISRAYAGDAIGTVTEIRGMASAETAADTRTLVENAPVFVDDLLNTDEGSRLVLQLRGGILLRIGATAKLRVSRYSADIGGEIVMDSGQILCDGRAGWKGLTVRSPYASIAVRGTKFFAGEFDHGYSVFSALGVVIVSAGGTRVTLRTGDGTDIPSIFAPPIPARKWSAPKVARAFALVV